MAKAILDSARKFVDGEFKISCVKTPGAPEFIEAYEDQIKAAPGIIQVLTQAK